jgi:hypothetical protein
MKTEKFSAFFHSKQNQQGNDLSNLQNSYPFSALKMTKPLFGPNARSNPPKHRFPLSSSGNQLPGGGSGIFPPSAEKSAPMIPRAGWPPPWKPLALMHIFKGLVLQISKKEIVV